MYDDWIAKSEAATKTGLSTKTLERMANDGKLRREYVNVPGRKPLPVFEPLGIEQLANKTLTPIPVKNNGISASRQIGTVAKTMSPLVSLSESVAVSLSLTFKRYLTVEEAALFLGLSPTYVRNARKAGALPGLKIPGVRGWRFLRDTLRHHQVSLSVEEKRID